jgi:hypothetical protein
MTTVVAVGTHMTAAAAATVLATVTVPTAYTHRYALLGRSAHTAAARRQRTGQCY